VEATEKCPPELGVNQLIVVEKGRELIIIKASFSNYLKNFF